GRSEGGIIGGTVEHGAHEVRRSERGGRGEGGVLASDAAALGEEVRVEALREGDGREAFAGAEAPAGAGGEVVPPAADLLGAGVAVRHEGGLAGHEGAAVAALGAAIEVAQSLAAA